MRASSDVLLLLPERYAAAGRDHLCVQLHYGNRMQVIGWCGGEVDDSVDLATLVLTTAITVPTPRGPARARISYPNRRADWVCLRLDDRTWHVVAAAEFERDFRKTEED